MDEFIDHRRVIVKYLHHDQTLTRKNDQSWIQERFNRAMWGRSNAEISRIPNSVSNDNRESTVINQYRSALKLGACLTI